MQVTTKNVEAPFQPVKMEILLESQEEVDMLYELGNYSGLVSQAVVEAYSTPQVINRDKLMKFLEELFYKHLKGYVRR